MDEKLETLIITKCPGYVFGYGPAPLDDDCNNYEYLYGVKCCRVCWDSFITKNDISAEDLLI